MIVRRCLRDLVLGAVIVGLPACAGTARSASAHEFVAAIYAAHVGPNQGFALDANADFRRYFEPALAARMIRAAHEAWDNRNRAWLDVDLFADAKAWSFTAAHVAIARRGRHRAIAIVTFAEDGRRKTIRLDLVRLPVGWRIRDIHAPSGDLRRRLMVNRGIDPVRRFRSQLALHHPETHFFAERRNASQDGPSNHAAPPAFVAHGSRRAAATAAALLTMRRVG